MENISMKKYILTWILLLGCFSIAFAQKNMSEIKGVVLDENKEPLIPQHFDLTLFISS